MFDLTAGGAPAQQVAAHDNTISCIRYLDMPNGSGQGVLVTAGWDSMVKVRECLPFAHIVRLRYAYACAYKRGVTEHWADLYTCGFENLVLGLASTKSNCDYQCFWKSLRDGLDR